MSAAIQGFNNFVPFSNNDILLALNREDKDQLREMVDVLETASTSFSTPEEAKRISDLSHCIFAHLKYYFQNTTTDPLIKKIDSLLGLKFLLLPQEMMLEIFFYLSVPELLKIRQWNRFFQNFIDTTPFLQARISHFALILSQKRYYIPSDQLKLYLEESKLMVEINQSLCLWKLNLYCSKELSSISYLVVKNCLPDDLKNLFNHLVNSQQLTTLYLCDYEFNQDCYDTFQKMVQHLNQVRKCTFYLCHVKTPEYKPLEEEQKGIRRIEKNQHELCTIEFFLHNEFDDQALNRFEEKVKSKHSTAEEVLASAHALRPHVLLPIISSIWHIIFMDPSSSCILQHKMVEQVMEFLKQNPHNSVVLSAIKFYQKNDKGSSS